MPMSMTTTNRVAIDNSPRGKHIASTASKGKRFITMVALREPGTDLRTRKQRPAYHGAMVYV